jgi:hypothetical protein
MVRPSALTMPVVTVLDSPSGAPSATTGCPIRRSDEFPTEIECRSDFPLTRTTARSVDASRPVIVACAVVPSLNRTSSAPPITGKITWLLVRM